MKQCRQGWRGLWVFAGSLIMLPAAGAAVNSGTVFFGPRQAARYFQVVSWKPWKEPRTILLDETRTAALRYRTPLFGIRARVRCLREGVTRNWKIGFVQVLRESRIVHTYRAGNNHWHFATLPINDSVGTEYPWMDGTKGYARGYGTANLAMDDNFDVNVGWYLTRRGGRTDRLSDLVRIERRQHFSVYIAALDEDNNRIYLLNELRWVVDFTIAVDMRAERGSRARVVAWDLRWDMADNPGGDVSWRWFRGPAANFAQKFIEY